MHVLFDIGHPAHVHLFRHAALALKARGERVTVTIRDRGIVSRLLTHYGLEHSVASRPGRGMIGLGLELLEHNRRVLDACGVEKPDMLVGTSVSAAHVGALIGRPSIIFNEDDADYVPLFARLTYPFAHRIVIPETLRDRRTRKTRTHRSYHELAYLHPAHFTPDPGALDLIGVRPGDPFFIVRLVSLSAHHDVGEEGLSAAQALTLVERLKRHGRVLVNGEAGLPEALEPYAFSAPPERMHDILAQARLLVSDSQTMTMEAAVLGVPALRCNSFVGRCSVITELEERYRLAWGFRPAAFNAMLETIEALLGAPDMATTMAARRAHLLAEKHDLAAWMLAQIDAGFP